VGLPKNQKPGFLNPGSSRAAYADRPRASYIILISIVIPNALLDANYEMCYNLQE